MRAGQYFFSMLSNIEQQCFQHQHIVKSEMEKRVEERYIIEEARWLAT
jgi:hypothetical protein